ncbi:hypothetical protein CPC08DRAFT_434796 [Agrocybe pediades]|nr:hypothetical protein CPC08DRAFT_434796 [Agrocybe pediades]
MAHTTSAKSTKTTGARPKVRPQPANRYANLPEDGDQTAAPTATGEETLDFNGDWTGMSVDSPGVSTPSGDMSLDAEKVEARAPNDAEAAKEPAPKRPLDEQDAADDGRARKQQRNTSTPPGLPLPPPDNEQPHPTETTLQNEQTGGAVINTQSGPEDLVTVSNPPSPESLPSELPDAPEPYPPVFPPLEKGYREPEDLLPAPVGGFLSAQGLSDRIIREHVHPSLLLRWEKEASPGKVFVYIPFYKPEADCTVTISKIKKVLRASFGELPRLIVGAPKRAEGVYTSNRPIDPFFVSNITEEQARLILERGFWSTPDISFFPIPYYNFVSNFVMTIGNLALGDDEEDNVIVVAEMVREQLKESKQVEKFIERHHDAFRAGIPAFIVLDIILNSVEAYPLTINLSNTETTTVYNVFMTPPTSNSTTIEWWINLLKMLPYETVYGIPTVRDNFSCTCCRSFSHPTGLCPYVTAANTYIKPPFDSLPRIPEIYHNSNAATRGKSTKRGRGGPTRGNRANNGGSYRGAK